MEDLNHLDFGLYIFAVTGQEQAVRGEMMLCLTSHDEERTSDESYWHLWMLKRVQGKCAGSFFSSSRVSSVDYRRKEWLEEGKLRKKRTKKRKIWLK